MQRLALSLIALLLLSASLPGQPQAAGDLTLRARTILHKHCAKCHDGSPAGRGELAVLERAGLNAPATRAERPFLVSGQPDLSQLLQLIEEGSMPPGTIGKVPQEEQKILREWITAQAPSYPKTFDTEYVLGSIVEDIRAQPAEDRPHQRYFSLVNQLPAEMDIAYALEPKRAVLREAVRQLAKDGSVVLVAADGCGTVLRVDLRQTGWDLRPFSEARGPDRKPLAQAPRVNLFDLFLLEYPRGEYYPESKAMAELTSLFLKPAEMVRPIPFLQSDWFVSDLFRPPLSVVADEVRQALAKAAALPRGRDKNDDKTPRPALKLKAPSATALLPLDATTLPDYLPEPPPFQLVVETLEFKSRTPQPKFRVGEQLLVQIRCNKKVYIDVFFNTEGNTKRMPIDLRNVRTVEANDVREFWKDKTAGYTIREPLGRESVTVFASESPLPDGIRLMSKQIDERPLVNQRMIHDFFPLPGERRDKFDPAKIVKKTIYYEIVAK